MCLGTTPGFVDVEWQLVDYQRAFKVLLRILFISLLFFTAGLASLLVHTGVVQNKPLNYTLRLYMTGYGPGSIKPKTIQQVVVDATSSTSSM